MSFLSRSKRLHRFHMVGICLVIPLPVLVIAAKFAAEPEKTVLLALELAAFVVCITVTLIAKKEERSFLKNAEAEISRASLEECVQLLRSFSLSSSLELQVIARAKQLLKDEPRVLVSRGEAEVRLALASARRLFLHETEHRDYMVEVLLAVREWLRENHRDPNYNRVRKVYDEKVAALELSGFGEAFTANPS